MLAVDNLKLTAYNTINLINDITKTYSVSYISAYKIKKSYEKL